MGHLAYHASANASTSAPRASALPAARAVGPRGSVVAVDLAERLLQLGRAKAHREGLANIEFRAGDMTQLGFETAWVLPKVERRFEFGIS